MMLECDMMSQYNKATKFRKEIDAENASIEV